MTLDASKPIPTSQAREAAKTERHPEVTDHAADDADPEIPGGNRPDAAMGKDPTEPGAIDKSKT